MRTWPFAGVLVLSMIGGGLGLTGCGEVPEPGAGGENPETRTAPPVLTSSWKGSCRESRLKGMSMRAYLQFSPDGRFVRVEEYAVDPFCKNSAFRVVYRGEYFDGGRFYRTEAANKLDLHFQSVGMIALNDGGRKIMETNEYCGYAEWAVGEERDVTPYSVFNECAVQITPRYIYDIYGFAGRKLLLGRTEWAEGEEHDEDEAYPYDRLVPGNRPVELWGEFPLQETDVNFALRTPGGREGGSGIPKDKSGAPEDEPRDRGK